MTKIVLGTVKGDLHDIGKNLVGMMLEGAGFEVVDLGIDVPPEKFIQSAKESGAQIIGMSALLTTTMMQMQTTVQKIKAEGLKVKTVIGGAPVTAEFAKQIGADGLCSRRRLGREYDKGNFEIGEKIRGASPGAPDIGIPQDLNEIREKVCRLSFSTLRFFLFPLGRLNPWPLEPCFSYCPCKPPQDMLKKHFNKIQAGGAACRRPIVYPKFPLTFLSP